MKFRNKFRKYYMHSMAEEGGDEGASGSTDDDSTDAGNGGGDSAIDTSGDDDGSTEGVEDRQGWPEDWQTRMSRGDEKLLKTFGRYASPEAVGEALIAAQRKIRSGEMVPTLPDKPTEAQLKEYRNAMGVPEAADKYDLGEIDDDDKDYVDQFRKVALANNLSSAQAKATLDWFNQSQELALEAQQEQDQQDAEKTANVLAQEWGNNHKQYSTRISNLLNFLPENVREAFHQARLPGGTGVFNDPDILRGLLAIDMELNPAGTVTTGSGDPMKGIDEEITSIEKTMRTNRAEYNKDETMQSRYRELIDAREKLNKRKAG